MKTLLVSAALAAVVGFGAQAQDSAFNLSAGYSLFDLKQGDVNALTLRGGYNVSEMFGVDLEGSMGIKSDKIGLNGYTGDVKLNYALGAFARAQMPLGEQFNVYGRVGYSTMKLKYDFPSKNYNDTKSGLAYGAGAEWNFSDNSGLRLDFTRHHAAKANQWNVSYVYRF
ncbi:porin family protein [Woodsholea maritima]|uniref:porin family protein n=1 Tax=Woodsholea maritima TaxID=240237 RepID=UPI00037E4267|nr:porin family protein [Woodsholea maritima]